MIVIDQEMQGRLLWTFWDLALEAIRVHPTLYKIENGIGFIQMCSDRRKRRRLIRLICIYHDDTGRHGSTRPFQVIIGLTII